jgi:hypothetical protein
MNFKELLEPYKENGRTIEGQIKWLNSKGIARNFIDQAILKVFSELETGTKHSDGNALDHYLLQVAKDLQTAELEKQARELEVFMTTFKQSAVEEYVKAQRGSIWKRVKSVFKPA